MQKTTDNDSKIPLSTGQRLRRLRRKNCRTQADYSSEFNVSIGTIRNYESGRTRIPLKFWTAVLEVYGPETVDESSGQRVPQSLNENSAPALFEESHERLSIFGRFMQFRERTFYYRTKLSSPLRRFVEDAMLVVFLIAALTLATEQVRRLLPFGTEDPGMLRDTIFVVAFVICALLVIPVVLSSPWGLKIATKEDK